MVKKNPQSTFVINPLIHICQKEKIALKIAVKVANVNGRLNVRLLIVLNSFVLVSEASCFEKQLLIDLFEDYDKDMRPVLNDEDTVTVTLGLSLHQIMDVVRNYI